MPDIDHTDAGFTARTGWFLDIRELPDKDSTLGNICNILDIERRANGFKDPEFMLINDYQGEHVFTWFDPTKECFYRGVPLGKVKYALPKL